MFANRSEAGRGLAERLGAYRDRREVLILALPRGGAIIGREIAASLHADLDVLIVRKIGVPWQPELAAGALSETGAVHWNRDVISSAGGLDDYLGREVARQRQEIARRVDLYRQGAAITALDGRTVILVDDGVATGATIKAAIETLKKEPISRLAAAVPVAPPSTADELRRMVDEFVCLETPGLFLSVGGHYRDFTQVTDEEVVRILKEARAGSRGLAA
jgi:predicted phosphoribosyltransferase